MVTPNIHILVTITSTQKSTNKNKHKNIKLKKEKVEPHFRSQHFCTMIDYLFIIMYLITEPLDDAIDATHHHGPHLRPARPRPARPAGTARTTATERRTTKAPSATPPPKALLHPYRSRSPTTPPADAMDDHRRLVGAGGARAGKSAFMRPASSDPAPAPRSLVHSASAAAKGSAASSAGGRGLPLARRRRA